MVVAYFYFTDLQLNSDNTAAALQAILVQIIQLCHLDSTFVDAASVLREVGSGRHCASENEVQEIFGLYIKLLGPSYLVFDGLDECCDADEFVDFMLRSTQASDVKVLILTRPGLGLPSLSNTPISVRYLSLENTKNRLDIERYIRDRASKLVCGNVIRGGITLDNIVVQLSDRANSIFLWASLMCNFLALPFLTPLERLDAIQNLNRFEGLDSMYLRILEEIERRTPEAQCRKILLLFQWLAVARRPLTIDALRAGLAVQKDRRAIDLDYVLEFEKVLPQMCGSLVEIRADNTADFIHISVIDFLTRDHKSPRNFIRPFQISLAASEASMVELSLRYLSFEVPRGPLTCPGNIEAQRKTTEENLPLLSYLSEFWPLHAAEAIASLSDFDLLENICLQIHNFICTKHLITMWVEVIGLFASRADLKALALHASLRVGQLPPSLAGSVPDAFVHTVRQFASQMDYLLVRWSKVLSMTPSEIWKPSIQAWSMCDFVVDQGQATVAALNSCDDLDWILIASETSSDGQEVAAIKVLPPSGEQSFMSLLNHSLRGPTNICNPTWMAKYTIWSMATLKVVFEHEFELHRDPMTCVIGAGTLFNKNPSGFRFPVAFSPTLRTAVMADLVLRVEENPSSGGLFDISLQILPAIGCESRIGRKKIQSPSMSINVNNGLHVRNSVPGHKCHDDFEHFISPCSRYIATVDGFGLGIVNSWVIVVYGDAASESAKPCFAWLISYHVEFSPFVLSGRRSSWVCFHPYEQVLAFCPDNMVVIWHFTIAGQAAD